MMGSRVMTYVLAGGLIGLFTDGIMTGAAAGAIIFMAVRFDEANKTKEI
ncbi:hypothetical protein [Salinicoccus sp. HZC-1]